MTGEVKQNHESVPVNGYDAVFALAALNKEPEVKYWFESGLVDMGPFIFRAHEGKLEPLVNVDLPSLTVLDGITGIFTPSESGDPGIRHWIRQRPRPN